jgi:hypothetical protein
LVGKSEKKRLIGKPRLRWKEKLKINLTGLDSSGSG